MKNVISKILVATFLFVVVPASSPADSRQGGKEEILAKLTRECKTAGPFPNSTVKYDNSSATMKHPLSFISVAVFSRGNVEKYFNPELSSLLLANDLLFDGTHFSTDFKNGTSYFLIQCQSTLPVSLVTNLKNSQAGTNSTKYSGISNPRWNSDGVQFQNILSDSMLVSLNMTTLPRTMNVICTEQHIKGSTSQFESRFGFSIFHNKLVIQAQLDFKAEYIDKNIFVEIMSKGGVLRVCLPMCPSGTENMVGWLNKSTLLEDFSGVYEPSENLFLRHVIYIIGAVMMAAIIGVGFWKILQRAQELDVSVVDMPLE